MADAFTNYQTSRFATPPVTDIDAELAASAQRMQRAGLAIAGSIAPPAPEELAQSPVRTAKVAYDPTQGKLFIGGYVVDKNNDTDVAVFSKYAGQEAELPEGNWQDVDPNSFTQYVQGIRDPGTFKLMARNFGMGADEMQQMAGLGLQWLGAESAGQYLADQEADLQPNQVYSRSFTDIGSSPENGVLDWMAATIGRLGPNIVESTISAAAGAAIGGAVSGPAAPAGAAIGAIAGFLGKTATKKALFDAAKKRMKGEALDAAEKKLLLSAGAMTNEALAVASRMRPAALAAAVDAGTLKGAQLVGGQVARRAAQVGGAAGLSTAFNIFQQTGAAYGETMADGSEGDRATALGVGIIGGLADTIPEFILAGRLFSELGGDVIGAAKKQKSAMDILKGAASGRTGRVVKYAGAGAVIEGGTEGFQEVLQIAANPILDLGSPEASNRIVNAFAAGALMGGTLGGAGGAFAGNLANNKQEANLLLPVSQGDPAYAQYREDLKAKLGDKKAGELLGDMPRARDVVSPLAPGYLEGRVAEQDALSGLGPLRQFAGQPPVPLSGGEPMVTQVPQAQPFVPPTGAGTTIPGMSGTATGTLPEGITPTVFPGQPLPTPPAPQIISMGATGAPAQLAGAGTFEQFQAAAMQQAQQAAAAAAPVIPSAQDLRYSGIPQPAAAGAAPLPGGESINARLLRGGMTPQATPPAYQQGTIQQVVEQGPLRMAGQAAATMVPPLRPTRVTEGFPERVTGQATARMVQPLTAASVTTFSPNVRNAFPAIRSFIRRMVVAGQDTFTEADVGKFLFPLKAKLNATDKNQVQRLANTMVEGNIAVRDPQKPDTYAINKETVRGFEPGTGGASLRTLAEIPADRTTGEQPPAEPAASGTAGKGNRGRSLKQTAGKKPASKAQGSAARSQQVQAEEDIQPAVELNLSFSRSGFSGDYLKNKQLIGEGSEATVYRSGDKVIKIHEPYYSKEPMTERVDRAMLVNQELGDGSLRLEGFYKSPNGTQNPVFSQNFIDGRAATRSEIASHMQSRGWTLFEKGKYTDTFSKTIDGKELVASDLDGDNVKVTENGKITVIDANISPSPKAPEVAAASNKKAAEPELTDREVWDETFADDGVGFDKLSDDGKAAWKKLIARKGGFTVADAEELQAQFAPKKTVKELAAEVRDKANVLIKDGLDNPNLPIPKNDLEELYFAVAKVRTTDGVDFSAALSNLVSFLGSGYSREAQRAARAYLDAHVEEVDVTVAKARLAAANKKAMEADKARTEAKKTAKAMEEESKKGMFMLSQFDAVANPIDENGRPAKGVNPIRVKAIVDNFKRGLAKAPTFHVYKNQADLQRRNPSLYQQAVGSRPQGDFDTAPASGFAFDGKVIVFTDRIPTEKYMRLLLAHESIGHFGMRSLLPAKQFDALMDYVYENNMAVRRAADSKLAGSTDLGARREAVEEYMAKYAEKLDSSVLTRVWNAIKDVLNKLGIKFEDDIVRYLVSQARRTVREGSSMFTPSTFALNVHTITTNNGTGRFSTAPLLTDQHAASNAVFLMDAPPASIERANQTLKDFKIDSVDKFERIVRTFLRQGNFAALRNHGVEYHQNLLQSMATAAKELVFRFNQRLGALLALNGDSRKMVSNAFVVSRRIANRRYALPKDLRDKALLILGDAQPDETREIKGDEEVIRKLVAIGTLSKKELEDGATVTYEEPTEDGKFKKVTVEIPGLKGLLKRELTQEEYDLYKKTREDLAALDVERLIGQYQNFLATEKISTKGIRKVIADKNMTEEDVTFVKGIVNHAKNLFISEIDYDERGIANITPKGAGRMEQYFAAINNAVVKREFTDDLKAEVRKFYLPEPTKDEDGNIKEPSAEALAEGNKKSEAAIKRIEAFRSRRTEFTGKEEQSVIYTLQDRIKEIVLADAAFDKAQAAVRRSIASSHVPLWREGAWQVRVEAQINGKPQKLHPEVQNKMILSLHEKQSESENVAALINEKMKDLEYSGLVYNEETGEYKTQTFKLFAVPSKTVDSVASDPSIDIDNLLYTLRVLGQPLTPDKHAKAITMLTAPGSALRKALRFDDSPGYDPNRTIDAIARHVTTRASLIAKTRYQPVMRELLDRTTELGQKWFGDKEAVMTAKENLDKATDQKAKDYWQDKLTTDLYKYVTTNPGAKGWDGSRATFPNQPTKASLGMRDYSDAVKTTEWLMDSANINESTFEGKRYAALAKMITSVGFLGGMMTQFAQNLMSFPTNVLPLLASKDSQTGFGGGFGFAVMPMYLRSFKDANFTGFSAFSDPIKEAQAFNKIATEIKAARDAGDKAKEAELVQQYNLSYYEALNIAREIREGKLIPSQALALLETARGIFTGRPGKFFLKFSDWYMLPFNVSEQATRRASFLTAFRLEFDRLVKAGFNEDKASEMARVFAVNIVDRALGNYDASNRPPIWRDGLMSMLFVYKTYPLTSLSLLKNLSRNGKIGMLTALWVMAGAAGFPLVDDMEDFIDTLAQRLGLDIGQGPSVRMAIIRQLEEVFPGWSDFILRGPMNHYTGADVGAKFGLENFIPGTGILLKGANTTEELKDIAGPVFGMGLSMSKFAYDAVRAPFSSTVSAVDVLRESPISLMRAGGDVAAYLQNGAIVDRRGYVVTPEVSAMTMLARLAGFYPAEAAKQYDFIKYANRMNYDYKEVGMAYKLAWIKAKKAGNEREAARIVREVNEWNEANRGGPGFLRNFLKNSQRQLKEANRPAGERFLKAAPVASRAEYDRFLQYITGE